MDKVIVKINKDLEDIKRIKNDFEYWLARDLMIVLGYSEWRTFSEVIKKAKIACVASGYDITGHFVDADKMVITGSMAQREINDFRLSRYACYLIAQNGDSRKPEIAFLNPSVRHGGHLPLTGQA